MKEVFVFFLLSLLCIQLVKGSITITGAGALSSVLTPLSSQFLLDEDVKVVYDRAEFQAAKASFQAGDIDFILSTSIIPVSEHVQGSCCLCDDTRAIPMFVGGVAIAHSVGLLGEASVVPTIVLQRQTIVDIFTGVITRWDDPRIASMQNFTLPSAPITVFYRGCSSTQDIFMKTMASFNGTQWTGACPFPVGTVVSSDAEMSNKLSTVENAIGYIDYNPVSATNSLVNIVNKAGVIVTPTVASIVAASSDHELDPSLVYNPSDSLIADIEDSPGAQSWPFSGFYYATLHIKDSRDTEKLTKFYGLLHVMLAASQTYALPFGYGMPATPIVQQAMKMLRSITSCVMVAPSIVDLDIEGTTIGADTFSDISQSVFSGSVTLDYKKVPSSKVLESLATGGGKVAFGLSVALPAAPTTDIYPFKFVGSAVACIHSVQNLQSSSETMMPSYAQATESIVLDGKTLAGIFARTITSWNDSAIISSNEHITHKLNVPISVVPFGDQDVSEVMVTALSLFDPSLATQLATLIEANPSPNIQATIAAVRDTPNSISCVSYSEIGSQNVNIIAMINREGNTVYTPDNLSISQAMKNEQLEQQPFSLLNTPGVGSWPLTVYTYLLLKLKTEVECVQLKSVAQVLYVTYEQKVVVDPVPAIVDQTDIDRYLGFLYGQTCGGAPILDKTTQVNGVGATFPLLVYQSWAISYRNKDAETDVEYMPSSSMQGSSPSTAAAQFGGTDFPLPSQPDNVIMLPIMASAIALIYNLDNGDEGAQLVFDRKLIVDIYSGVVTMWNDPAIVALNPGVTLPAEKILLVHRFQWAGSAYILSSAISLFSGGTSTIQPSMNPNWPVTSDITATTSADLALKVKITPNTLGYVQVGYANNLDIPYVQIINRAGTVTKPDLAGITSAMADKPVNLETMSADITDGPGVNSYPLSAYTYIVIPKNTWPDYTTAHSTMAFLWFGLSDRLAQRRVTEQGFVSINNATRRAVESKILEVTHNGRQAFPELIRGCDGETIAAGPLKQLDACGVCNGDNSTCCLGTPEQIEKFCFKCQYTPDQPYALNIYMCDDFIDCADGEDDIDCGSSGHLSIIKLSTGLSTISGVLILVCVAIAIDIYVNRKEKMFRENNVLFMMLILGGCIIGYASVFVFSQLSRLNDFVCGVQYWFFSLAFVLTFGAMIAKTYQVYMLHRQNAGDMSMYTNKMILRYVGLATGLVITLLTIWTAFDVPKAKLVGGLDPMPELNKEHYFCENRYFNAFAGVLAGILALILLIGMVISFLSRNIEFEGNEARLIRITISAAGGMAGLVVPLLLAFSKQFVIVKVILSCAGLIAIISLIIGIYFGPRMWKFHFRNTQLVGKRQSRGGYLLGPIDI